MDAFVLIETDVGKAEDVAIEASRLPGVRSAEPVTGPYDVIVLAETRGAWELGRLVAEDIGPMDGVTRTVTCPVDSAGISRPAAREVSAR